MGTNDDLCLDRCVVGASTIAGVHDAQAKILNQEWPSCSIHQESVLIGSTCGVVSSLHALFVRLYEQYNYSQRYYLPIEKVPDPTKRSLTEAKAHRSIIRRSRGEVR